MQFFHRSIPDICLKPHSLSFYAPSHRRFVLKYLLFILSLNPIKILLCLLNMQEYLYDIALLLSIRCGVEQSNICSYKRCLNKPVGPNIAYAIVSTCFLYTRSGKIANLHMHMDVACSLLMKNLILVMNLHADSTNEVAYLAFCIL